MPTIRVAIAGATGYAGEELIRLLLQHPHVQLTYLAASAERERPTPVSEVYPHFAQQLDLPIEALDASRFAQSCDAAFLALPHGASSQVMTHLIHGANAGSRRVIDLAGDFRLLDEALHQKWYSFDRPAQVNIQRMVAYGLTEYEYYRQHICGAQIIANPGCYATSILLAAIPLFQRKLVVDNRLVIDAKSGFSGAGRQAGSSPETKDNLRAYKVNQHQHMPEVLQALKQVANAEPGMVFVPQVLPTARGLISTLYLRVEVGAEVIQEAYQAAYPTATTPFVRIRPGVLPQLRDVVGTNFCDIGFIHEPQTKTLVVASALDNLVKGAAGQAIQNFNLMYGFPETTALL